MEVIKILNIDLMHLRNNEHFQFGRNVLALVDNAGIEQQIAAPLAAGSVGSVKKLCRSVKIVYTLKHALHNQINKTQ